jgi:hypothetical protein
MKNIGLVFLLGGWIALTVYGVFRGVLEAESIVFKISISVVWIGFLILLISALRQRFKESKKDPYKDVEV